MNTKAAIAGLLIGLACASAAVAKIGTFQDSTDIGAPKHPGSARHVDGGYLLTAGGANMFRSHDEFRFVWRKLKGDFVARVAGRELARIERIRDPRLQQEQPQLETMRASGLQIEDRHEVGLRGHGAFSFNTAGVTPLPTGRRYAMIARHRSAHFPSGGTV